MVTFYTDPVSRKLRLRAGGTEPPRSASNSAPQIPTQGLSNEQSAEMATNMAVVEATVRMSQVPENFAPEFGVDPRNSPHIPDELLRPLSVTHEAKVTFTADPHNRNTTASPSLNGGSSDAVAGDESTEEHQWWMETDQEAGMHEIDRFDWGTSR